MSQLKSPTLQLQRTRSVDSKRLGGGIGDSISSVFSVIPRRMTFEDAMDILGFDHLPTYESLKQVKYTSVCECVCMRVCVCARMCVGA